jgi:hypothetical protein
MSRVGSPPPASEEHETEAKPERRSVVVKAVVGVAFLVIFLTVGVPRFFAVDDSSVRSDGSVDFSKLCRDHGGTPSHGTGTSTQPVCNVTYGGEVYRMDAITPKGFDADTAAFQKQGCEEAQRQEKAEGAGAPKRTFVYHADTGVCEHRP